MLGNLYKLDRAAWFANSQELRDRFTKVDRFGESYEMFIEDPVNDLIGLPRNYASDASGATFAYSDLRVWDNGFKPRDEEQERLVADMVETLKDKMGAILEAPTGYGKTYLGSAIIQRLGQKACIITTKQDLMKSWREALSNVLCVPESDVQFWNGDNVPDDSAQAVVALVQSVCKGYDRYPRELYESFGLVMVDEVHRMGADEFSKAMWHFPARYRVGLSATPYRKDGRENVFEKHIGEVEVRTEALAMPFKVIVKHTGWKVPEVWNWQTKKVGPLVVPWDRAIIVVKHLQDDWDRNDIIGSFSKAAKAKGRNNVIFSDTVDHLKAIQMHLISHWGFTQDDFGFYVGLTADVYKRPKKEQYKGYREDLREQAKSKNVCLATYKMCSEGTDVPWWDTCVLGTAKSDVKQIVGRIRREYPNKPTPVVLDLVDNHKVFHTFAKKREKFYSYEKAEVVLR